MQKQKWLWLIAAAFLLGVQFLVQKMYAQTAEFEIYFGDFHTHTGYSDGQGTPEEAFEMAKNSGKADFMATTDHDFGLSDEEWDITLQNSIDFTDETFVAIRAWEWTNGPGHMNLFNIDEWWRGNYGNPEEGYDYLQGYQGVIGQWDHPTWNNQPEFDEFSAWSPENDNLFYMCEMQGRNYYDSYVKALDKGWHVGPANNSDTHSANWIDGYEERTAVLATELTEEAIFEGVRALRFYGTLDRNLRLTYSANGRLMGSMLPEPDFIDFEVSLIDPDDGDDFSQVEVIVDEGEVAFDTSISGNEVVLNFTLPGDNTYYFLRITQDDNDVAWSSPVWSSGGEPDPIGITTSVLQGSDVEEITITNLKGQVIKKLSGQDLINPNLSEFSGKLFLFVIKDKKGIRTLKKPLLNF